MKTFHLARRCAICALWSLELALTLWSKAEIAIAWMTYPQEEFAGEMRAGADS